MTTKKQTLKCPRINFLKFINRSMQLNYLLNNIKYNISYLNKNISKIDKDINQMKSDKKILFLFDENISKKIVNKILAQLKNSGCDVYQIEFLGSKKNKNLKAVLKIIDFLISKGFTRKSIILSLGGGVLGDLSALAASLYMRGLLYMHIPTTITSMVDSCIGGKTAINYQGIINSIGTYYHPHRVYLLNDIIKELPDREFYSGLPEILKCGLIKDKSILDIMEKQTKKINIKEPNITRLLCFKSLKTKIFFFKNDVFEQNERLMLNFGHTFAHAIEMAVAKNVEKKTEILRHGEAVGIGMLCEIKYANNLKMPLTYKKTKKILELYNLPTNLKFLSCNKFKLQNDIFKFLFLDKKRIGRFPRYINLRYLGKPKIAEMSDFNKINHIINGIL